MKCRAYEYQLMMTLPNIRRVSVEIEKFVRKVNSEMIGFYCNHNTIDEKCEHVFKNMTAVYNSDEYREYESFINCLIISIESIIYYEENDGYPESPEEEKKGMACQGKTQAMPAKPYNLRAQYSCYPSDYRLVPMSFNIYLILLGNI